MTYYRALSNLHFAKDRMIPQGRIFWYASNAENIKRLIALGHISLVSFPPLQALPKWKTKASKLEKWMVYDVGDFLQTKDCDLADWLSISKEKVNELKTELVEQFMVIPVDKKCCGDKR